MTAVTETPQEVLAGPDGDLVYVVFGNNTIHLYPNDAVKFAFGILTAAGIAERNGDQIRERDEKHED